MRSTYGSSQRQRSRQRTREGQYSIPRDTSPDDPYNRNYSPHQFAKKKRVKFNDEDDIRVFKKQDEPIARSLTQDEIFQIKKQIEKQVSRIYDFNWDQKKHFDALSQQNSMKEQKQKEKELYEKLMGMKEQIQFYSPYSLALPTNSAPIPGCESIEKEAHTQRTRDVLGCYYTQVNQIPNQPIFEVIPQTAKSQPKVIFFNPGGLNEGDEFVKSSNFFHKTAKPNERELKGIIKMPEAPKKSVEREISPRLLWLLKDMQVNKEKYHKEMRELILKPYKDSGELDFWMNNVEALNEKLKNQPVGVPPPPSDIPVFINPQPVAPINQFQPIPQRMSPCPVQQFRPQFHPQPFDPLQQKAQKFKTVPCKYYHGPQGCVKTQNCTFIHDQQYKGMPHPLMLRSDYQQYQGSGGSGGFGGGFRDNQGYGNRRENFGNFGGGGGYRGDGHQGGHFHQNKQFHHGGQRKFEHYQQQQQGGYPGGGGYNPQQPRHYQSYGQHGHQPGQHGHQQGQHGLQPGQHSHQPTHHIQPGQMPQSNYPSLNPQMTQPQQPIPGYQGYPNQGQQQMYYGQGQMGNMPPRNPNQK